MGLGFGGPESIHDRHVSAVKWPLSAFDFEVGASRFLLHSLLQFLSRIVESCSISEIFNFIFVTNCLGFGGLLGYELKINLWKRACRERKGNQSIRVSACSDCIAISAVEVKGGLQKGQHLLANSMHFM
ncbi:hypothetical protein Pyn_21996 [Prunus yedoensis var. nudiflora]|uniref:Uncharacterized protein n=1 Tax=Prunus yedoensis var. nudiflora TaxID=2094558 RepID=A0A314Y3I5_PRUYE|nr:hypothetical protein Pyn_21996 [Prunus yedoensis var. nudiflora]